MPGDQTRFNQLSERESLDPRILPEMDDLRIAEPPNLEDLTNPVEITLNHVLSAKFFGIAINVYQPKKNVPRAPNP